VATRWEGGGARRIVRQTIEPSCALPCMSPTDRPSTGLYMQCLLWEAMSELYKLL
jgi:hypothetical protein